MKGADSEPGEYAIVCIAYSFFFAWSIYADTEKRINFGARNNIT